MTKQEAEDVLDLIASTGVEIARIAFQTKLHFRDGLGVDIPALEQQQRLLVRAMEILKREQRSLRREVPTGLKLTPEDLAKFDDRFSDQEDYAHKKKADLLYALSAWVFDQKDEIAALGDVKTAFGVQVCRAVKKNLKDGNHDT